MKNNIPSQEDINKQKELIGDWIVHFALICGYVQFEISKFYSGNHSKQNIKILLDNHSINSLKKRVKVINQLNLIPELSISNDEATLKKSLSDNWKNCFVEIFLEGLTAEPTKNVFQSLIKENFCSHLELIEICKNLSKKFSQLSSMRNTILHGIILLGWNSDAGDMNPNSMLIRQLKIKENFLDKKSIMVSVSDLKKLSRQANAIFNGYVTVSAYILETRVNFNENQKSYIDILHNTINNIGVIGFSQDNTNSITK